MIAIDILIYTNELNNEIIPQWINEIYLEYNIKCEIYPNIDLNDTEGFLPFKILFEDTNINEIKGKYLLSGFEFYVNDNDDNKAEVLRDDSGEDIEKYRNKIIDAKKNIMFSFDEESDPIEGVFSYIAIRMLAKLLNGVIYDTYRGIYFDSNEFNVIENDKIDDMILEYSENGDLIIHEFEEWH